KEKKLANVTYADLLHVLKIKKAHNVRSCGQVLEFKPTDEGYLKLYKTWFCKSKLCPVCNWRRAMKNSYQAQRVVEEVIKEKPKARWLFITLSTKNAVDGQTLNKAVSEMTKAFDRLMRYKKISKNLIGFMRTTEVTVNSNDGSYNQHLHVLLCVEPTYFKNKENYIEQNEWIKFWKRALKINYEPVVHVKAITPNRKKDSAIVSAIKETSKY
ncbi:protein rep, partial [Enterococcus faecalis]|uniref:protein rep n=1 Tax=Enterococcus faecalis TaxID=1351 RepID=UPI00245855BE